MRRNNSNNRRKTFSSANEEDPCLPHSQILASTNELHGNLAPNIENETRSHLMNTLKGRRQFRGAAYRTISVARPLSTNVCMERRREGTTERGLPRICVIFSLKKKLKGSIPNEDFTYQLQSSLPYVDMHHRGCFTTTNLGSLADHNRSNLQEALPNPQSNSIQFKSIPFKSLHPHPILPACLFPEAIEKWRRQA